MKKILIALALGGLIIACGGNNTEAEGNNTSNESSSSSSASTSTEAAGADTEALALEEGKKIYKQYCVACHGLYGDMGANGAYNLTESTLGLEEKIEVITNGRNTMTPWKGILSPEKIEAVAKYTLSLKKEEME